MAMFTNQTRFTGMSGLDVNQMVSDLMRAHSVRVDRMRQNRDVLLWQREALRGAAADLRSFRDQRLSFTSNQHQNIRSVANFSSFTTSILNRSDGTAVRGVTVSPVDPASATPRQLQIVSAARGDVFRSADSLNRPIAAARNLNVNDFRGNDGFSMRVELNGRAETITIAASDIPLDAPAGSHAERADFVNVLNERLRNTFGSDVAGNSVGANDLTNAPGAGENQHVWASLDGNRLVFNTRSGNNVTIANGPGASGTTLERMGFDVPVNAEGNRVNPSTSFNPAAISMAELLGNSNGAFNFELNGTIVAFNGSVLTVDNTVVRSVVNHNNLTLQDVMNAVNNAETGARMSFSASTGRFTLESRSTGVAAGSVEFRDLAGGFFNRMGLGTDHNARAVSGVQSGTHMNNSNFGIRTNSGGAFDVSDFASDGFSLRFNLNEGVFRTITISSADLTSMADNDAFIARLNAELLNELGYAESGPNNFGGTIPPGATQRQNVWASIENGELVINAREGNRASIADATNQLGASDPGTRLSDFGFFPNTTPTQVGMLSTNFNARTTTINDILGGNPSASDPFEFTINGADISFDGEYITMTRTVNGTATTTTIGQIDPNYQTLTMNRLMDTINDANIGVRMSYDSNTGRFNVVSTDGTEPEDIELIGDLFDAIGLGTSDRINLAASRLHAATDAVIYLDGNRFVRASNNFRLDGLDFVLDPHNFPADMDPVDINLSFERDTSNTLQLIRDFVEEYNSLIRSIRELTETRRPRQSLSAGGGFYMPLTDEQRRGMSEREIELWEEQARTGILHRDDTLRRLSQDLHRALFQNVPLSTGGTINLLQIGIRTNQDLTRFGELQIDEERLQYALDNNLDGVTELFTNMSDIPGAGANANRNDRLAQAGLGQRINDIIQWQLSHGGGLYDRVGATSSDGSPVENNTMNTRIRAEDDRIDNLIRNLQRREQRYFIMFGRLESAMIQANSQMMFMEQMFWMG